MNIKIAVISDIHASENPVENSRSEIIDVFLLKAVHRLNRWIKPDVVLIAGDIIHDPTEAGTREIMSRLKETLCLLKCPFIIIPGNHDCDRELFYEFFTVPEKFLDVKGFRFVPFIDIDLPDCQGQRSTADMERMKRLRNDHAGPIITMQHTSLFPPGTTDSPYNLTNAEEIISAMKEQGIFLSISGHYHEGFDLIRSNGPDFITAPAFCEDPFSFLVIETDGSEVNVIRHQLKIPEHLCLTDNHIHTPLAYCNDNMDIKKSVTIGQALGLAGIVFTEHTGQLYFREEDFWSGKCFEKGMALADAKDDRMSRYFGDLASAGISPGCIGLEVDCDYDGNLMVKKTDADKAAFLMGSIHSLKELEMENPDEDRVYDEFFRRTEKMVNSGIKILAHPFRMFHNKKTEVRDSAYGQLVKILCKSSVAVEMNFHTQVPSELFIRLCLQAGVKLTLAGDAHNLCEVGEFAPHLKLLSDCGYNGDLKDILLDPRITL